MAKRVYFSKTHAQHWEIDWSKRRIEGTNSHVWARNPKSHQERTREWHWTTWGTLRKQGIKWFDPRPGRYLDSNGYWIVSVREMTQDEKILADRLGLWIGRTINKKRGVKEHRLVAAKKYGYIDSTVVVRHVNGIRTDNRPENLVLGSIKDNRLDHREAIAEMMVWRDRALRAEALVVQVTREQVANGEALEALVRCGVRVEAK